LAATRKVDLIIKVDRKVNERESISKMEGQSGRSPTLILFGGKGFVMLRRKFPAERSIKVLDFNG
jgi:hypothetical protein